MPLPPRPAKAAPPRPPRKAKRPAHKTRAPFLPQQSHPHGWLARKAIRAAKSK